MESDRNCSIHALTEPLFTFFFLLTQISLFALTCESTNCLEVASFEQQYKVWTVGRDVTEMFPEARKPALA